MQKTRHLTARRTWLCQALAASATLASLCMAGPAVAQTAQWPTRPVKIVVASAAGVTDLLARMLAPRLEAIWKQPVIVENKAGASGIVGTAYVVNSNDGHTLLLGTLSSLLAKYTTKNLQYDPLADLVPIYRVVNYELILVANAKTAAKAKTLRDVVALSNSSPNGLFYAGTGPTSIQNLCMAILNQTTGMRMSVVDYSNVGAVTLAMLRDDTQLTISGLAAVKGQIDAGELVPLAAYSAERFPSLPNVPTVLEAAGHKGFLPQSWGSLFAPKGTPQAVIDRIGRDVLAVLSDAEFSQALATKVNGQVVRSSPAAFAKEYHDEANVWKDVFAAMKYVPQ